MNSADVRLASKTSGGENTASPTRVPHFRSPDQYRRNIPDELKSISRWLVCKVLPIPAKRKLKKLPCTVNSFETKQKRTGRMVRLAGGDLANPLDSRSWGSFDAALDLLGSGQHQMLGIVLTDEDEVTAIDMDEVLEVGPDGQLLFHQWEAEEIYRTALELGAYIQLSASKNGLHIFVRSRVGAKETIQLPGNGGQVEIFSSRRFIAMTGDQLGEGKGNIVAGEDILDLVRASGVEGRVESADSERDFLHGKLPKWLSTLATRDDSIWPTGLHADAADISVTGEVIDHVISCMADLADEQVGAEDFYKKFTRCVSELCKACDTEEQRELLVTAWDDRCSRAPGYNEANNLFDLARFEGEARAGSNQIGPFWLSRQVGREEEFYDLLNAQSLLSGNIDQPALSIVSKADIPLEALGPVLGKAAAAIAETVQVPPGMAANAVLAHAAFVAQPLCNVGLDGRVIPLSLFMITVAESGDRKSASDNVAGSAVLDHQQQMVYEQGDRVQEFKNECAVIEKARKQALGQKGGEDELRASLDALPEPQPPPDPHFIVQEPTLEGLQKAFKLGLPNQLLNNDEGAQFFGGHSMNPENRQKTIAGLSKFWDGSPISRTRAAVGESTMLFNRRLSIHLQMQPIIADTVLDDPLLMQQGILARFLIADCESLAGTRLYNGLNATQHSAVRRFHMQSLKLLSYKPEVDSGGGLVLPVKKLSSEARAFWIEEYNRIERELGAGGDYEIIKPFAAKAAENALRLAAVFSIYDADGTAQKRASVDVSRDQMRRAWQLIHYYMQTILRRTQLGEINAAGRQAMEVLEWLRSRGGTAKIAEMQKQLPRREHRKSVAHIRSLMEMLVQAGRVRLSETNKRGDGCEWEVVGN